MERASKLAHLASRVVKLSVEKYVKAMELRAHRFRACSNLPQVERTLRSHYLGLHLREAVYSEVFEISATATFALLLHLGTSDCCLQRPSPLQLKGSIEFLIFVMLLVDESALGPPGLRSRNCQEALVFGKRPQGNA